MILSIDISEKSFGNKLLYNDLKIEIQEGEKVGVIGRNGTGKSTLLNIVSGEDSDYAGEVNIKRGSIIISSRQEHFEHESKLDPRVLFQPIGEWQHHGDCWKCRERFTGDVDGDEPRPRQLFRPDR